MRVAQNFNFGCWVIGWICFAFQLACLVFAVLQFFVAVFNHSGRHTCGFGVPLGYCPAPPPFLFTILFYFISLIDLTWWVRGAWCCTFTWLAPWLRTAQHTSGFGVLGLCLVLQALFKCTLSAVNRVSVSTEHAAVCNMRVLRA